jgi:hypothetical protein
MTQRKAFLTFCEQSLPEVFNDEGPKTMSKHFFTTNLFPALMELQHDKVMSVRRKFCIIIQKVMLQFLSTTKKSGSDDENKEVRFKVLAAFDKLKNDIDDEVSEQAYDSEQLCLQKYKELSEDEFQDRIERERRMTLYEKEMDRRDIKEQLDEE